MSGVEAIDLDDRAALERSDPSGMQALIEGFPAQAGEAWRAGCAWPLPISFRRPSRVLVAGIGGSAIGADIVATLALERAATPVQVLRGYRIPPLDEDALLVGCSFSGSTSETCAALAASVGAPGMRLALTTGGALGALAEAHGWPAFRYAFDGPPRSALAWSTFPLLAVLARVGALALEPSEVVELLPELHRTSSAWGSEVSGEGNLAKRLATQVAGRPVLVLGAGPLDVAARRWAAQLNENAKQWAVAAALPEANHNLIVPLAEPRRRGAAEPPFVVILAAAALEAPVARQAELTAATLAEAGVPHELVRLRSERTLGAILEGCQLGDWVSLYAAALNGVDPMAVEALDRFKARVAAGNAST